MVTEHIPSKTKDELVKEIHELQLKLQEAEDTITAIQNGEIDAIVTQGPENPAVYTLEGVNSLYRGLIEEMSEGVATLTYDGAIFYCNAQLASLLQVPLNKIIGLNFNDFIIPEDLRIYWAIFENGLKTKNKGEINIKSFYGVVLPVHISINTLKDLNGVYVVITDLSKLKKAENKLREYQKSLEEKVEKRTEELAKSNAELEHFAYIASHDLREPLRMITSFLQLLERRYSDKLDQDANEFIGFAVDGAQRLDEMIKDLLEYSQFTNIQREFENLKLEKVLEESLINLKVSIEENKAVITHDSLPIIEGDEQLLVQLFQNLIGNAIKYRSQETPHIHISVKKETNQYLFSIEDNGIGINSEHLNRIFKMFQRLHQKDEYEGTGIGLSITKKIITHHGGQIWAESEPGKGSTFYFTIPSLDELN
jgi:two-component system, chemotaxis family, sensor kinase Cph1